MWWVFAGCHGGAAEGQSCNLVAVETSVDFKLSANTSTKSPWRDLDGLIIARQSMIEPCMLVAVVFRNRLL